MLKYLPNMLACHVSILHDAHGPNNSVTEGDAASLLALGEAYRILGRDQADFFLVGGAESKINPLSLVRQCLFEPLSRRNDAPEKACRPFDRNRDGLVVGEGAGVFVLEELEHARKRGARIYAEVVGFGAAFSPNLQGDGLARAVRAALKEAGIGPEEVDHVNAHGLASRTVGRVGGAKFARGFRRLEHAGDRGEELHRQPGRGRQHDGAGRQRAGLQHGLVPATLNYEEPDPAMSGGGGDGRPAAGDATLCGQGQLHPDGPVCGRSFCGSGNRCSRSGAEPATLARLRLTI